jgi:hypothetical protein
MVLDIRLHIFSLAPLCILKVFERTGGNESGCAPRKVCQSQKRIYCSLMNALQSTLLKIEKIQIKQYCTKDQIAIKNSKFVFVLGLELVASLTRTFSAYFSDRIYKIAFKYGNYFLTWSEHST